MRRDVVTVKGRVILYLFILLWAIALRTSVLCHFATICIFVTGEIGEEVQAVMQLMQDQCV